MTRKISYAVARIKHGVQEKLHLGNLDARRDWGFAGDYVEAMWLMLQQPTPDDFVIATGEAYSVREFLDRAFGYASLDWSRRVEADPRYLRPAEVDHLLADAAKAKRLLCWEPKLAFRELVRCMADADLEAAGVPPPGEGLEILAKHGYEWILNRKAISGETA